MTNFKKIIALLKEKNYVLVFYLIIDKVKSLTFSEEYRKNITLFKKRKTVEFINSCNILEETEKVDSDFYKRKAIIYFGLGNKKEANIAMQKSFQLFSGENTDGFIKKIEKYIFKEKEMYSEYVYLGGQANLGVILHTDLVNPNKKYITKIIKRYSSRTFHTNKEIIFNEIFRKKSNSLKEVTPEMVSYMKYKKLMLLTFEKRGEILKVNNLEVNEINDMDINKIIKLNNSVTNFMSYNEVLKILKENQLEKYFDRGMELSNKRKYERDFELILRKKNEKYFPEDLLKVVNEIKYLILDSELYKEINPSDHFVFSHGDFGRYNITYDNETKKNYIIDWENYEFNIKGYDMVRYLTSINLNFKTIKNDFIEKAFTSERKELIGKTFVTYQFLIQRIKQLDKENEAYIMKKDILPAFNYLKTQIENYRIMD